MIVTDLGFEEGCTDSSYAEVPLDSDGDALQRVLHESKLVITVENFADGRAFSLARHLRLLGFAGHIRVKGDLIPDQYAMARRCGIDDLEISQAHAERCQAGDWRFRANWTQHDYQARLQERSDASARPRNLAPSACES